MSEEEQVAVKEASAALIENTKQMVNKPTGPEPSPQERAEEYKTNQLKAYADFIYEFKDEEESLKVEPDFTEKIKELEKFKKNEIAKQEKLIKREINEWEDLYQGNASLSKSAKGLS